MTSGTYRFGLLAVVFGGFVSLNSSQFGGLDELVAVFGMTTMVLGGLLGALGLVPEARSESS
ncbi:hypothetical protein [Halorussus aquaticus]|uniref:Uncharacterized protein n=1 Tax=Halorussus aquaticus TaxID=2953748 RepID=A0ABD5PZ26_9EURY|nr:hypothetical protein [Halorussus aquaticus]